jgi:hypothetical protein
MTLIAPSGMALGVDPDPQTDSTPPSAIEQALMDYTCRPAKLGTTDADAYEACLRGRVQSLRNDFGVNLKRLTSPERRTLDAICSKFRLDREREDYVQCLNDQLVVLRDRWNKGKPPAVAPADSVAPITAATPNTSAPSVDAIAASVTEHPQPVQSSFAWWMGGALALALAAGAGAAVAMKARRPPARVCRTCGAVPESGDLCAKCRHEAAEALRRTAVERAEEEKALDDQRQRQRTLEEEQRDHLARQDAEARLRDEERARQEELARRAEEKRQCEEEERRSRQVDDQEAEFDPHVVLGVPPNASKETVLAAYKDARAKYDPEQVADFGPELQKHYKVKSDAVERAFQLLAK